MENLPMGDPNSQLIDYKLSALAIELNSSKLVLGRSVVYPSGVLYIYHFSSVVDFSSERYIGSTGHRYSSVIPAEKIHWECRWGDSNSQPLNYKTPIIRAFLGSCTVQGFSGIFGSDFPIFLQVSYVSRSAG